MAPAQRADSGDAPAVALGGAQQALLKSSADVLDLKITILQAALVNARSVAPGNADLSLSGLVDAEGTFKPDDKHAHPKANQVVRILRKVFLPAKAKLLPLRAVQVQVADGSVALVDCKKVRKALNAVPSISSFEGKFTPNGLLEWPPQLMENVPSQKALMWADGLDHGRITPLPLDQLQLHIEWPVGSNRTLNVTAAAFPGIKLFMREIRQSERDGYKAEHAAQRQGGKLIQKVLFHGTYLGKWDSILRTRLEIREAERGASMKDGIYGATKPFIAIPYCRVDRHKDVPDVLPRSWVKDARFKSKLGTNPYIIGVFKACLHADEDRDKKKNPPEIWVARSDRRALLGFLLCIDHPQYLWSGQSAKEMKVVNKVAEVLRDRFDELNA